jgi:hypothetical protein
MWTPGHEDKKPCLTFIKIVHAYPVDFGESFGEVGRWGFNCGQGDETEIAVGPAA